MVERAWQPGPVLGIETSCDETAASVFEPRWLELGLVSPVLSDIVASQVRLHAPHGGVVPELASRQHLADIRPVVVRALAEAGLGIGDLAGVAVTVGPGLIGALLVGVSFAKSLVVARRGLPLVGIHHLEGHVRAAFLEDDEPVRPYLALVVSGGHTSLLRVDDHALARRYSVLACTRDDAAGEAFDKVGKLLGLGYPAGAVVDQLARDFRGEKVPFRPARVKADGGRRVEHRAFSFSGIKTAARQEVLRRGIEPLVPGEDPASRGDVVALLAGFQEAVVGMLVKPTLRVLREEGFAALVAVGGVAANSLLRVRLAEGCAAQGVRLVLPPLRWATDNGAMIAAAGALRLAAGERAGLDLSPDPSLLIECAA